MCLIFSNNNFFISNLKFLQYLSHSHNLSIYIYISRNSTLAISRLTYPWVNFWKSLNNQMKNFQDFLKISVLLGFYNYFSLSFDTNTILSTWVEQTVWIKFNFFSKASYVKICPISIHLMIYYIILKHRKNSP